MRQRVTARRRRGLSVALWALGLVVVSQLLGSVLMDRYGLPIRFAALARVYEELDQQPAPGVVFVGSSRFECAIKTGVCDGALQDDAPSPHSFNAAVPAGDAIVARYVLRDLLERGCRPRLLVIEVAPENLCQRENWLDQQAMRIMTWSDFPEAVPAMTRNGRLARLVSARFTPLYLHRYHLRKYLADQAVALVNETPSIARPARPVVRLDHDPPPPPLTPEVVQRMQVAPTIIGRWVRDYRVGGVTARALERLLEQCRREGVTAVLVGPPVSSYHYSAYTPQVNTAFLGYMADLEHRYDCRFVDYRDRMADGYFHDCHHLNEAGAVCFSRRLSREVLLPLWRDLNAQPQDQRAANRTKGI